MNMSDVTTVTKKGSLEAFVEEHWAVIFPTKAHPLFPKEGK